MFPGQLAAFDESLTSNSALEQTRAWMRLGKNSTPVAAAPGVALRI